MQVPSTTPVRRADVCYHRSVHYPGLFARPWHDPADYPFTARLERKAPVIRAELLRRLPDVRGEPHPMGDELADGAWDALFLYSVGEKRAACAHFPETTRIVESIPGATRAGLVYFSVLRPGAHVKPHHGPTNTRIRCHLGLMTPKRAWLRVGQKRRSWRAGKCLVFDDSFEHESKNSSGEPRIVLIVDVWHPSLSRAEQAKLYRLFRTQLAQRERSPGAIARHGALSAFANLGL